MTQSQSSYYTTCKSTCKSKLTISRLALLAFKCCTYVLARIRTFRANFLRNSLLKRIVSAISYYNNIKYIYVTVFL